MLPKCLLIPKRLFANITFIWFFSSVNAHVYAPVVLCGKSLLADITPKWLFHLFVGVLMQFQEAFGLEPLSTIQALKWKFCPVRVLHQYVISDAFFIMCKVLTLIALKVFPAVHILVVRIKCAFAWKPLVALITLNLFTFLMVLLVDPQCRSGLVLAATNRTLVNSALFVFWPSASFRVTGQELLK